MCRIILFVFVAGLAFSFQIKTPSRVAEKHIVQYKLDQNLEVIRYYKEEGEELATQLMEQAQRSFQEGEIDFLQYVQLMENSMNITLQYLQSRYNYQINILEINYLIN